MTATRLALGLRGEALVADALTARGWRVIDRRWRSPFGEIDLVAMDGDEVVFIEVKTRRGHAYGMPEEAVDRRKRLHLRRAAAAYLDAAGWWGREWRIDVAAVTVRSDGRGGERASLRLFRAAVGESG